MASLNVNEVIVCFEGLIGLPDFSFPIFVEVALWLLLLPLMMLLLFRFLLLVRSSKIDNAYGESAGGQMTLSRSSISYLMVSDLLLTLVNEVLFDAEDGRYFDIKVGVWFALLLQLYLLYSKWCWSVLDLRDTFSRMYQASVLCVYLQM